ncbi:MAG: peptide chain release factor N(5)-glutamine methyltransferase [Micrococcales bacterium]
MRLRDVVAHAVEKLASAGIENPTVDVELLVGHVLGLSRGQVQSAVIAGSTIDDQKLKQLNDLFGRRFAREPVQHLTGVAYFRQLELSVGRGVFVPRPETESVVQLAIDFLNESDRPEPVAVDLGTGSGAIALAMHTEVAKSKVYAVEKSPDAYQFTQRNFARYPGAELVLGDLADSLNALNGAVTAVVSNPPYIPADMVPIDPEVHLFDPSLALYGGSDGLDVIRQVSTTAKRLLHQGGFLVIEHADSQSTQVCELLLADGWQQVTAHQDLTGRYRSVSAIR